MEEIVAGFETLDVWKQARVFRIMIIDLCKQFSQEEKYRLADQVKRSSRSVTANIAEGYGRFHYLDNIKFCRNARGSLNETLDHLITALDEGYIVESKMKELKQEFEKVLKLLNGYIGYLKKRRAS